MPRGYKNLHPPAIGQDQSTATDSTEKERFIGRKNRSVAKSGTSEHFPLALRVFHTAVERRPEDGPPASDNKKMTITHTVIMTFATPQADPAPLQALEDSIRKALVAEGLPACGTTELSEDGLRGRLLLECRDAAQMQRLVQPLLGLSPIVRHATGIFQVKMGQTHDVQVRALKNG